MSSPISSRSKSVVRRGNGSVLPDDAHGDVVVEIAAHAREFSGGAEVADRGHVRIGRVTLLVEELLPGEEEHLGDADLGERQPDAVRADSEVLPPG